MRNWKKQRNTPRMKVRVSGSSSPVARNFFSLPSPGGMLSREIYPDHTYEYPVSGDLSLTFQA